MIPVETFVPRLSTRCVSSDLAGYLAGIELISKSACPFAMDLSGCLELAIALLHAKASELQTGDAPEAPTIRLSKLWVRH